MTAEIRIDESLKDTYSEIRLGCLRLHGHVRPSSGDFWKYMDTQVIPEVRKKIEGLSWNEIPGVRGSRECYRAFGRNPGRYRVSSESLLRRVKRGDELYHVNDTVDVNNLISLESGCSVGSYDLGHLKGEIILRKAQDGEGYQGIGKSFLDLSNMLVLCDEEGIFGSSMSDSTRSMITEQTTDVLVVIYCFEDGIDLKGLVKDASHAFEEFTDMSCSDTWMI